MTSFISTYFFLQLYLRKWDKRSNVNPDDLNCFHILVRIFDQDFSEMILEEIEGKRKGKSNILNQRCSLLIELSTLSIILPVAYS
jgi:hypothetical protein